MNEPIHAALTGAGFSADGHTEGADFASDRILARIGHVTRTLRDSMRAPGPTSMSSGRRKPCPMRATGCATSRR